MGTTRGWRRGGRERGVQFFEGGNPVGKMRERGEKERVERGGRVESEEKVRIGKSKAKWENTHGRDLLQPDNQAHSQELLPLTDRLTN